MNVGGVEKALSGVLNALDPTEWDIYLDLIIPEGGFMPTLPPHIKTGCIEELNREYAFCQHPVKGFVSHMLHGRPLRAVRLIWHYAKAKKEKSLNSFCRYITRGNRAHDMMFDAAVSFHGPSEYLDCYVADCVKARRKYGWIHFDVSRCHIKPRSIRESYSRFHRIFLVSQEGKAVFDRMFPELSNRTALMPNMVSRKTIERMADESVPFVKKEGEIHVVTVGRLSHEKGQDLALLALKHLRDSGINVIWHFVGGGTDEERFRKMSRELSLGEAARFHGVCLNPYPYMKHADVYMQPSRHEGYGITIQEALTFGTPTVSTDTTGGRDQLSKLPNGVLTGFTPEEIADGVRKAAQLPAQPHITADTVTGEYISKLLST